LWARTGIWANVHTYTNDYADADLDAYTNPDADLDAYTNPDSNGYTHTDPNSNRYSLRYSNTDP